MKKIVFLLFLICVWALGIYEGNCNAAVLLSLIPLCQLIEIACAIIKWQSHKRINATNKGV